MRGEGEGGGRGGGGGGGVDTHLGRLAAVPILCPILLDEQEESSRREGGMEGSVIVTIPMPGYVVIYIGQRKKTRIPESPEWPRGGDKGGER